MPWDTLLSGAEKLLHWFSPRFMCFVFLFCSGMFFMPSACASYLSVQDIITAHRAWWGMGMIVSLAYLIPFGVSPFAESKFAALRSKKENGAADVQSFPRGEKVFATFLLS